MKTKVKSSINILFDMFSFPTPSSGLFLVVQRNFYQFSYTFWVSALWVMLEPIMYLLAIGYGLGYFVGDVLGVPYEAFYAPALLAISGMFVSFYESTYGVFSRLERNSTYPTYLISPVSAREIAYGEIFWCTFKGALSLVGVSLVILGRGYFLTWNFPLALLVVVFFCWIISSLGVLLSCRARSHNIFIYFQSFLILPMALFSGTYFPLEQLPQWLKYLAMSLPLTHVVIAVRGILNHEITSLLYIHIAVIFCVGVLLTNLAVQRLEQAIKERFL